MSLDATKKLRLITYLSPGIPVEGVEAVRDYLEQELGRESSLMSESRWLGPQADKTDPFTADEVDIGFMDSTSYLRLVSEQNKYIDLCEAAACHLHPKNLGQPVYYSDVIVSKNKNTFQEFHDLRGHSLAYSSPRSVSGSLILLEHLKKTGFNSSFFGSVRESGSHLNSIKLVLDKIVDTAAVDSNVLQAFVAKYPQHKETLKILTSLGPLPAYPIVFNNRMSEDMKKKITHALLQMGGVQEWSVRLTAVNMSGFVPCDSTLYNMEVELCKNVKDMQIATTYY